MTTYTSTLFTLLDTRDLPETGIDRAMVASAPKVAIDYEPNALSAEQLLAYRVITGLAQRKGHVLLGTIAQLAEVCGVPMGHIVDENDESYTIEGAPYVLLEAEPGEHNGTPLPPCVIHTPVTMEFAQLLVHISEMGRPDEAWHFHALSEEAYERDDLRTPALHLKPVDFARWKYAQPQEGRRNRWLPITLCATRSGVTQAPSIHRAEAPNWLHGLLEALDGDKGDTSHLN